MAAQAAICLEGVRPDTLGEVRLVARRPILDLRGRDHGFELVFRESPEQSQQPAIRTMQETAAAFRLGKPIDLKKLTGGLLGFVRCGAEELSEDLARLLPASVTVLEIPAGAAASEELVETCRKLKALGFRLALDDFAPQKDAAPLTELASYVMVDFGRTPPDARRRIVMRLGAGAIGLVARNVQTHADYKKACDEGFALFEGYHFCQPATVKNRRPPPSQLLRIEIVQALQKRPMDLPKVSNLVKRDGPLTFQLLRFVNSPLWAVRQEVTSIQAALLAVGEDAFRRIATVAIASEFNSGQPAALLCMAMVRGRFCELAGGRRGLDPFGQYLLGLLSLLPAMQGQPMSEVAPSLPLSQEIREALMGAANPERALLGWLEHCERGDWAGCDTKAEADGLDQQELGKVYVEAVAWAEAALQQAG